MGNLGLIPGLGRSPREGKGYPLQYSGLENSMDYTVHGVTKSQTQVSDFHFHFAVYSHFLFFVAVFHFSLHEYTGIYFSFLLLTVKESESESCLVVSGSL